MLNMKNIIFGKKVNIKQFSCNTLDVPGVNISPSANIFVKVTNGCNAKCKFCSNANTQVISSNFDLQKFIDIIEEFQNNDIKINKISITGGEPSLVPETVERILKEFSKTENKHIHLHLNTNGVLNQAKELIQNPRWNSISVSIHHYNFDILSKIYGIPVFNKTYDYSNIDKNKINISCNLIKGYIDSTEEVHKMLNFAIDYGFPRIGFVSLMKINQYSEDNYIDFDDISFESIPNVYFTKSMNRGLDCKCSNYLYTRDLKILEIYGRNYINYNNSESSFVYNGQHLIQGFHDNNIIY